VSRRRCDKRAIAQLLYGYGASIDEIAAALHLKPSTVKKYVMAAVRRPAGAQRHAGAPPLAGNDAGGETLRQSASAG